MDADLKHLISQITYYLSIVTPDFEQKYIGFGAEDSVNIKTQDAPGGRQAFILGFLPGGVLIDVDADETGTKDKWVYQRSFIPYPQILSITGVVKEAKE